MVARRNCIKYIVILGIVLITLQVLLSSKYDLIKAVYINSTTTRFKVEGNLYKKAYVLTQNGDSQAANETTGNSSLRGSPVVAKKIIAIVNNSAKIDLTVGHEGHNGFELAARASNVCKAEHITSPGHMKSVHTIPEKRLLYCPMEKIGTTFWRRVFYMLVAKNPAKYKQPYDVTITQALGQARLFTRNIPNAKSVNLLASSSFSFLFVRNPYSRLLSAFVDKLLPPNPTFWKGFGVKAITQYRGKGASSNNTNAKPVVKQPIDGHDVTFAEFLQFVVASERSGKGIDPHIISINKGCKPCSNSFNYIGKMESFKDDAMFIMKKLQMNTTVEIMEKSFSDYSTDDAITDSIRSPFGWKRSILKSISWEKALQRVWLKLQIRGIIEGKITLDLSKLNVDTITVDKFIDMARTAHKQSDPVELKKQKELAKKEAFASVRLSDLKAFRDTFKNDFDLFGYDHSPSYMFDRGEEPQAPTKFFKYDHLN